MWFCTQVDLQQESLMLEPFKSDVIGLLRPIHWGFGYLRLLQDHFLIIAKHVIMLLSFFWFLTLGRLDLFKDSDLAFKVILLNFYQLRSVFIWKSAVWILFEFKTQSNCWHNQTLVSNHSRRTPSNWWLSFPLYRLIEQAHFWSKHLSSSFKDLVHIHQNSPELLNKLIHLSKSERLV